MRRHQLVVVELSLAILSGATARAQCSYDEVFAADSDPYDYFGDATSVFGDSLLVGATGDDEYGTAHGAAYVFARTPSGWVQEAKLLGLGAGYWLGTAVALRGDTAAVGAPMAYPRGPESGAVYVFRRRPDGWAEWQRVTDYSGEPYDRFGHSISLSGNRMMVGSPGRATTEGFGKVSVYELRPEGWVQTAKFWPDTPYRGLGQFGAFVALSGNCALVAAPYASRVGGFTDANGAVYVYELTNAGWKNVATFTFDWVCGQGGVFGQSVALGGDTGLVGGWGCADVGGVRSGSVWVLERIAPRTWVITQQLSAGDPDPYDSFGKYVAIECDTAVIGATGDDEAADGAGAAYVFRRRGGSWVQTLKLMAPDAGAMDFLGVVSLHRGRIAVGAAWDDDRGPDAGSTYVVDCPALRVDCDRSVTAPDR